MNAVYVGWDVALLGQFYFSNVITYVLNCAYVRQASGVAACGYVTGSKCSSFHPNFVCGATRVDIGDYSECDIPILFKLFVIVSRLGGGVVTFVRLKGRFVPASFVGGTFEAASICHVVIGACLFARRSK